MRSQHNKNMESNPSGSSLSTTTSIIEKNLGILNSKRYSTPKKTKNISR